VDFLENSFRTIALKPTTGDRGSYSIVLILEDDRGLRSEYPVYIEIAKARSEEPNTIGIKKEDKKNSFIQKIGFDGRVEVILSEGSGSFENASLALSIMDGIDGILKPVSFTWELEYEGEDRLIL